MENTQIHRYIDRADADIGNLVRQLRKDSQHDEASLLTVLWSGLRSREYTQRFSLPQGGKIFDDHLRGLPEKLFLPFPSIAIEYPDDQSTGNSGGDMASTKRIAFAWGTDTHIGKLLQQRFGEFDNEYLKAGFWLWAVSFLDARNLWLPMPGIAFMFSELDLTIDSKRPFGDGPSTSLGRYISGRAVKAHQILYKHQTQLNSSQIYADLVSEGSAVMELMEALTCYNVHPEKEDLAALNKKRARSGKPPLCEYHTLMLDLPQERSQHSDAGGSHRSPMEHLRRGHIRKLQDGRNVFVRSTVVNAGSNGRVIKDYAVRSI